MSRVKKKRRGAGFGAVRAKPQVSLAAGREVNTEQVQEKEFVDESRNKGCRGLTGSLGQEVMVRKL